MKKSLFILFAFFGISSSFSQETPTSFTLQEAIDYALEHNRMAKNASRDIDAAKEQKWETTARGLPQISASIDYQNWLKQQVSLLPAAAFDNTQSTIDIVNDYFDANQTNFDINTPEGFIPLRFGTKQTVNATATISQLLFDGSYLVGLQSAKVFLEITNNAKVKTDLQVREAVINAYGNVLLAEESIEILNKNVGVLEKNLNEITKIVENGFDEEESAEQMQITLSSVKSNLNNTTRLKKLAYQMFNITLGLDINAQTSLKDDLEMLTNKNIDLQLIAQENNVENTIDFKIAKNDKVSKELLLKLEKSKALPSLSTFLNAGYNGNSDDFSFLKKEQQWFGSSMVGVGLTIPIFSSGMRSSATKRAKINLLKAEDNLTETEQKLKLQIASVKSDYQFAIEEYDNKKENLRLAERIEKKNQIKYFEGISSSFDLRQAQVQLYTAQQEFLQSMLNIINKKAALETIISVK